MVPDLAFTAMRSFVLFLFWLTTDRHRHKIPSTNTSKWTGKTLKRKKEKKKLHSDYNRDHYALEVPNSLCQRIILPTKMCFLVFDVIALCTAKCFCMRSRHTHLTIIYSPLFILTNYNIIYLSIIFMISLVGRVWSPQTTATEERRKEWIKS